MLLSCFFMQDPMAEITKCRAYLLPNARLDVDIGDGGREMRQQRDGEEMFKVWVFPEYISILQSKGMWLRRYLEQGGNQYKGQVLCCVVVGFFCPPPLQVHCRL